MEIIRNMAAYSTSDAPGKAAAKDFRDSKTVN